MEIFDSHFTEAAGRKLKEAIAEANGNEVYARGILSDEGLVEDVQIIARGNGHMVAAIMEVCQGGDYAIHNHPSSQLEDARKVLQPSDADVAIASQLGQRGVGSMIVDNSVRHSYVLVETMPEKKMQLIPEEALTRLLDGDGPMAHLVAGYEERPEQRDMMLEVTRAFNDGALAVVEAGTGTGKTLAYLVPAMAWSLLNQEKVVIATHTINLQEQLIGKDVPIASQLFKEPPKVVLVKGRNQYLCRRKAMALRSDQELIKDEDGESLEGIIKWMDVTLTGDRNELTAWPRDAVWDRVSSGRDSCLRSHCPYFKECFVTRARRQADCANIIITNHALLFSDLSMRMNGGLGGVLPPYSAVILDEAHNLEDSATDHFGHYFSRLEVLRALGGVYLAKGHRESGALVILLRQMEEHRNKLGSLYNDIKEGAKKLLQEAWPTLKDGIEEEFAALLEILQKMEAAAKLQNPETSILPYRLTDEHRQGEIWEQLSEHMQGLCALLLKAQEAFKQFWSLMDGERIFTEGELLGPLEDLKRRVGELSELASCLDFLHTQKDSETGHVSWIDGGIQKNGLPKLEIQSMPVYVGGELIENLYKPIRTVILTSATLSSGQKFDYLFSRVGLDKYQAELAELKTRPLRTETYLSSFDYRSQSALLLPANVGASALDGGPAVSYYDAILELLELTHGSAFILFTSYATMERTYRDLSKELAQRGMEPMIQGETSRLMLLQKFKDARNGVLFGLDSFWTGVDVSGEKLSHVIITKLPFPVPTEPIQEARSEALNSQGITPFPHYSLPQAVIKLRQGFGRLIRNKKDFGLVTILDSRIMTKNYGKTFMKSLPDCTVLQGSLEEILPQAKDFLKSCREK